MNSSIIEAAHDLIDLDRPVDDGAVHLFGHGKPFGRRWTLSAGTINLHRHRTFLRRLELDRINQRRFSTEIACGQGRQRIGNIFETHGFETGVTTNLCGRDGTIEVVMRPNVESPFSPPHVTTADFGRMILTDELLISMGVFTDNKGAMSLEAAQMLLRQADSFTLDQ